MKRSGMRGYVTISGNNYRLITLIDYKYQKVFVRAVLTHAEYDTDNWKNDPWFS